MNQMPLENASSRAAEGRVLIVDDNAINRKVFCNLFADFQCQIDQAGSGKESLEMIKEAKYDIIFMDHMMPEMDGVETFNIIKSTSDHKNIDTPVVVLTANAANGAEEEYLDMGFNAYLSKPVEVQKLDKIMQTLSTVEKKTGASQPADIVPKVEGEIADFPYIDGVDWQSALWKLRSKKILLDSIKGFSVTAKSDLDYLLKQFRLLAGEEGRSEFRIKVHSMKTNAATMGAYHVAGLAKYLEYAARDTDIETINKLMPIFIREWMALKEQVEKGFLFNAGQGDKAGDALPTIEPQKLFVYLDILTEAMAEMDIDRADAAMEELLAYDYPTEQRALIEKLQASVTNMDEGACKETTDMIKELVER